MPHPNWQPGGALEEEEAEEAEEEEAHTHNLHGGNTEQERSWRIASRPAGNASLVDRQQTLFTKVLNGP